MANQVIKKDGTKEPFDAEKIKKSIAGAAQDANVSEERKNQIVEQVANATIQMAEGKEEIASSELKAKILGDLDQIEPSVSAAWRKQDEEKGTA